MPITMNKNLSAREAMRYYSRLSFAIFLKMRGLWQASKNPGDKRQKRRAAKKAINLFMYLAKAFCYNFGTMPGFSDLTSEIAPATDLQIKEGLIKLREKQLPHSIACRIAKDLQFIRENVTLK
jgi:hypothetical protein